MCYLSIKELSVQNYRRFPTGTFALNPRMNVFAGRNGSGKTTLLEASAVILGAYLRAFSTYVPARHAFNISEGVSKTFWTCSQEGGIKAPLSKGAANKLLEAIYWRGIHAVGVYEFADGIGEFVHSTANPSTTFGGPPPFDKGGFAQKPSSPTILTYTLFF